MMTFWMSVVPPGWMAMMPARDPLRSLIYSAAERAVRDVYVDGDRVVADGRAVHLQPVEAAGRLAEAQARMIADVLTGARPVYRRLRGNPVPLPVFRRLYDGESYGFLYESLELHGGRGRFSFLGGRPTANPRAEVPLYETLVFACDDLRAYYIEAVTAQPGRASSAELTDWFWTRTTAAKVMLALRSLSAESGEEEMRAVAGRFVPEEVVETVATDC